MMMIDVKERLKRKGRVLKIFSNWIFSAPSIK